MGRMIMTGLYFIRFSSQNVCFDNAFIVKKIQTWTEPKSGKDEPKPNREFWTAGNRDISVNRGSPTRGTPRDRE